MTWPVCFLSSSPSSSATRSVNFFPSAGRVSRFALALDHQPRPRSQQKTLKAANGGRDDALKNDGPRKTHGAAPSLVEATMAGLSFLARNAGYTGSGAPPLSTETMPDNAVGVSGMTKIATSSESGRPCRRSVIPDSRVRLSGIHFSPCNRKRGGGALWLPANCVGTQSPLAPSLLFRTKKKNPKRGVRKKMAAQKIRACEAFRWMTRQRTVPE